MKRRPPPGGKTVAAPEEASAPLANATRRSAEFRPHAKQAAVLRDRTRFKVIPAGRRGGKTEIAAVWALIQAKRSSQRHPVWWVANTYKNAKVGLITALAIYPKRWIRDYSLAERDMHISFVWGGLIEFKSAERPGSLRGWGICALVAEEVGEWRRDAWEEVLRPTLADFRAPAIFIGTPKGFNLFYELYQRALDDAFPDWSAHSWTTYDNPHIDPAEVEDAKSTLPDRVFRQEYLAEFIADAGGVFEGVVDCLSGDLEAPIAGRFYAAGWDIAKQTDWSVLCIDDADRRHTVHMDRFQRIPYHAQARRVAEACIRYRAHLLLEKNNTGDPVYEMVVAELEAQCEKAGIPEGERPKVYAWTTTHASKLNLVNSLSTHIGQRTATWPKALHRLTHELQIFEWKGDGRCGAPDGEHDDCVIAKGLAVWLSDRAPRPLPGGPVDIADYM